ncbi:hypothetical protein TSOC_000412, partial [Tetrabaena socialis]
TWPAPRPWGWWRGCPRAAPWRWWGPRGGRRCRRTAATWLRCTCWRLEASCGRPCPATRPAPSTGSTSQTNGASRRRRRQGRQPPRMARGSWWWRREAAAAAVVGESFGVRPNRGWLQKG